MAKGGFPRGGMGGMNMQQMMMKAQKMQPACVDPDDVEMLEDLIVAGVNAALKEASDTVEREMAKITGGMGLGF